MQRNRRLVSVLARLTLVCLFPMIGAVPGWGQGP